MEAISVTPQPISDLDTGRELLAAIDLTDYPLAEEQLIALIDSLLESPPDPGVLLVLLEEIRQPLSFVEEEMAKVYQNKPLPLEEIEESGFQRTISTWNKMARAYALCARLEEPDATNPDYLPLMAMLLHRCIYYTGLVILEYFRARRELAPGLWLDLHGYYETAEEWGVAYTPVQDSLESSFQATHCAAAYTTVMLIEIASPYSSSVRTLNLIKRWATNWSPLVSIQRLDDDHHVPPYVVQLMKDQPLHPSAMTEHLGPDARRFDTAQLGLQINHMLIQLRQRLTPSQLGLGEETNQRATKLLTYLLYPWTQSALPRRFRRFQTEGKAKVATGFDEIYYFVNGEEFKQPNFESAYSRHEYDQMFTFRDRIDNDLHEQVVTKQPAPYVAEQWSIINESANGFRLVRGSNGKRVSHGQLLGLCPNDCENYFLARITWLMQERDGSLIAGVAVLPGVPIGISVRLVPFGQQLVPERYVSGFLLPPVPAIKAVASIVLPSGMYYASRNLDIYSTGEKIHLRMLHLLQRGVGFDQISYQDSQRGDIDDFDDDDF